MRTALSSAGGPQRVGLKEKLAGEEDQASEFDSRLRVTEDWKTLRYDLSGGTTVVYDGPCRLGAIYVEAAISAHDCDIKDDTTDVVVLNNIAVGTQLLTFKGTRITGATSGLRIVPNASSTGIIVVQYREAEFA